MTRGPADIGKVLESLRLFPVVFAHVGGLFDTATVEAGLMTALDDTVRVVVDNLPDGVLDAKFIVMSGMERIVDRPERCERLSNARAWAAAQLSAGHRIAVVSSVPKARLLGCDGSQLIIDARTAFVSAPDADDIAAMAADLGFAQREARLLWELTAGLPACIDSLVRLRAEGLPKKAERDVALDRLTQLMRQSMSEVGPELCAHLDYLMFESKLEEVGAVELDGVILEGLRGSGLGRLDSDGVVQLLPSGRHQFARDALREHVDDLVEPPIGLNAIISGLWTIERMLRALVKARARDKFGAGWREDAFSPELQTDMLQRVMADTLFRPAGMSEVGNPYEWLTFAELLEMLETSDWARPASLPRPYWVRLRAELLPLRNRTAHVRLPRLGDDETVRMWRADLRRRLRLEGGP